ncbi:MAG: S-methyl-5-thioribose-1-phosphate isomerase [Fibrobacterota bacterium]
MARLKTIDYVNGKVQIIDQTLLPNELKYLTIETIKDMYDAIKVLKVRGAPAIGIAGAFGACLGVANVASDTSIDQFKAIFIKNADYLNSSRPTAVNLHWAISRMKKKLESLLELNNVGLIRQKLLDEAVEILEEDRRTGRAIGEAGFELLKNKKTILTHCNAGGLATAEYGTALAPVYIGAEKGHIFHVYSDETRPLLQGARITTFELMHAGIPVTLICDNMAASVMAKGKIDAVIVGADRITRNGDTANKIGTYGVALLAKAHNIPFYVAAPFSTFDLNMECGEQIPIEERDAEEITCGFGKQTAPIGVKVFNPAFDVTPNSLITAFITDKGVIKPPYASTIVSTLG